MMLSRVDLFTRKIRSLNFRKQQLLLNTGSHSNILTFPNLNFNFKFPVKMPWDGRITGWNIFVSSLEKNDPNFRCAKSAGVNASMGSLVGAVVGFILTNTFVGGCAVGGFSGFFTVFIGSNCMCVYKNMKELDQESKT